MGEARAIVDEAGPSTSSGEGLFTRGTLVICPLVAVIQWRQEIEKFVAPDALNVCPQSLYPWIHPQPDFAHQCLHATQSVAVCWHIVCDLSTGPGDRGIQRTINLRLSLCVWEPWDSLTG